MKIAPLPPEEPARIAALRKYDILDTEPEAAFDNMVRLAQYICQTPFAAISLVDENRQWFKAIVGADVKETPRDIAFCAHTILKPGPTVVPNTLQDERFHDNPIVADLLKLRFYVGIPLTTPDGYRLGTLCVFDQKPRELSGEQMESLQALSESVMSHLELRLSHKQIRKYVDELQLAASIFDTASEAMLVTDADNRIITANPAFTRTTGYSREEVVGKNPRLMNSGKQPPEFYQRMWATLYERGSWSGELWNKRKSGELFAEWLSINVLRNPDGSVRHHVAVFSDITEKKQADEMVWKYANYDWLTQLPNRRLLLDRLEHHIKQAQRGKHRLALLFIDLDMFKQVNDTLGHDAGDKLLKQAAQRLRSIVRESDTVGRLGGDEFTAILPQIESTHDVERVRSEIAAAMAQTFDLDGQAATISASVGVAYYPEDASDAQALMRHADSAMYATKRNANTPA